MFYPIWELNMLWGLMSFVGEIKQELNKLNQNETFKPNHSTVNK